jgi:pilus assembly protein CpaE
MWSAAVAANDSANAGYLRACLQQTGQVDSVSEWKPSETGEWQLRPGEPIPDIVVLGMSRDSLQASFALAAQLRRARPTVHIVACAPPQQPELNKVLQVMRTGAQVTASTLATKDAVRIVLEAMRNGVQEFLPSPVTTSMLLEVMTRFAKEDEPSRAAAVEKLVVVMGAKGGVGASTIAVNLGVQLAQSTKKRVVLLDFARPLGHIPLLLDLQPRFSVRDATDNLDRLDDHFLAGLLLQHKSGLEVLAGPPQPGLWQQIPIPALMRIVNVVQSTADYVLMDFGSCYAPEWNPVLKLARTILLVAQPDVPSLWSMERLVTILAGLGRDPDWVRIVINRWDRKDDQTLVTVEKTLKRSVFARLPNDFRSASEAINTGKPLSGNGKNSLTSELRSLAGQLAGQPVSAPAPRRWGLFSGKAR